MIPGAPVTSDGSLTAVTDDKATELMRSAWATRRASLEAVPAERRTGLARAKRELATAASICHDQGRSVDYAQAVHLLAHVELGLGDE